MTYRKLLFGYCMRNGEICIEESESEIVRMIFDNYAKGSSYGSLADRLNERAEFDESTARAKAISLAAARFDALSSEDYETQRIQYILATTEQNGELDTVLLRQITSAILIDPTGVVSLKLKNGQIIKKE